MHGAPWTAVRLSFLNWSHGSGASATPSTRPSLTPFRRLLVYRTLDIMVYNASVILLFDATPVLPPCGSVRACAERSDEGAKQKVKAGRLLW